MGRRKDRWAPPPRGGKPPTEPVEAIDLYPNPLPPPRPPETRETLLADFHAAFASLTEDELKVARLWLYGRSVDEVCHFLRLSEKSARTLWRSMRRKLRNALMTGAGRNGGVLPAINAEHHPSTGPRQESGDTSPT
jgi:DNA-binding CsgD family transcriptional regulator